VDQNYLLFVVGQRRPQHFVDKSFGIQDLVEGNLAHKMGKCAEPKLWNWSQMNWRNLAKPLKPDCPNPFWCGDGPLLAVGNICWAIPPGSYCWELDMADAEAECCCGGGSTEAVLIVAVCIGEENGKNIYNKNISLILMKFNEY
jgi:hypothetical protein